MKTSMEIMGRPIKVYRRNRCCECHKCYEIDLENIPHGGAYISMICPYCNAERKDFQSGLIQVDDRTVRID
ncbi:MAG: hypothetical protein J6R47_00170 [Acholeplasmatales bacterium]|nr:hypothetical protein [Acholeplasmatales bacterium]